MRGDTVRALCCLVFFCAPSWARQPQTADRKLATGARLVADNCGDCEGRSVSEFDRGVALIEEALREGAKDRRTGLLALTDAYAEYAVSYVRERPMSEAARASWRKRLADVYRELLRDEPRNVSWWLEYATWVADEQEELRICQHVLQIQPDNAEAAIRVACLHAEAGQAKTAAGEFMRAVRLPSATPDMIRDYLGSLTDYLRANGHSRENSRYIEQVSAAASEALKARAAKKE